jgi:hypothetical protein
MHRQVLDKQQLYRHEARQRSEMLNRSHQPLTHGEDFLQRLHVEGRRAQGTLVRLGGIGLSSTVYHYGHKVGQAIQKLFSGDSR